MKGANEGRKTTMIWARTTRRTGSNSMGRAQGFGKIWRKENSSARSSVDIWRLGTESGEEIDRDSVMKRDKLTMSRIGLMRHQDNILRTGGEPVTPKTGCECRGESSRSMSREVGVTVQCYEQ